MPEDELRQDSQPVETQPTPASGDTSAGSGGAAADTSPPAEKPAGNEPTDMLSAVRAVLQPKTAEPSPAAGTSAGEPDAPSGTTPTSSGTAADGTQLTPPTPDEPPRDLTEADFADVEKPSVKKRIDTLLGQRAAARHESETLREPATQWTTHVDFLQQNGITPQQAQDLYGVGALLARGDFVNFLAAVEPYVQAARAAVGAVLPPDLQRRVDEGGLSQEDADELSRTRAAAAHAQRLVQQSEVQRTATADHARATNVHQAMTQWEAGVSARDPEYARKRDAVTTYATAMVAQRGLPPDPVTAIAWINEAYSEVNKLAASMRPPVQATPARPSSVAPATKALPEPRSLAEAVHLALQRTRAA